VTAFYIPESAMAIVAILTILNSPVRFAGPLGELEPVFPMSFVPAGGGYC
jgi:hypothetical protein